MSSFHGKNGAVYIQGSGGTAVAVAQRTEWTFDVDYEEAASNAMGDTWAKALQGLRKGKGSFKENLDNATTLLWDAFSQTTPRSLYLYPDSGTATNYWYGTVWPKFSADGNLTKVVGATVNFTIDGTFALNGTLG